MSVGNTDSKDPKNEMLIEQAYPDDTEAISELLSITWLDTYPNSDLNISKRDIRLRVEGKQGERVAQNIERWRGFIKAIGPYNTIYVARLENKLVGVVSAGSHSDHDNKARIGALYVLPEVQGRAVGSLLMKKALNWLGSHDDIYVVVASYNQKAIQFYNRFGFTETGTLIEDLPAIARGDKPIPEMEMMRPAV
jgi:ribosomal protein S18 acetylase RimI-like enzyme